MTQENLAQQDFDESAFSTVSAESQPVHEDYFGFDKTHRVYMPDGVSYVEHKEFTEGQRREYLNQTNKAVRLQRSTGDAVMQMAAGDDRYYLLKTAICGWNLYRGGQPVDFTKKNLEEFLEKANPAIVDKIEKDIRNKNPWLLQDVSVEDIDQQMEELSELRKRKVAEEEGKDS